MYSVRTHTVALVFMSVRLRVESHEAWLPVVVVLHTVIINYCSGVVPSLSGYSHAGNGNPSEGI